MEGGGRRRDEVGGGRGRRRKAGGYGEAREGGCADLVEGEASGARGLALGVGILEEAMEGLWCTTKRQAKGVNAMRCEACGVNGML